MPGIASIRELLQGSAEPAVTEEWWLSFRHGAALQVQHAEDTTFATWTTVRILLQL